MCARIERQAINEAMLERSLFYRMCAAVCSADILRVVLFLFPRAKRFPHVSTACMDAKQ
jgi:hypothetical protein